MADIQGIRTKQTNLNQIPHTDGQFIVTDTGSAYIDFPNEQRIQIRNIALFTCSQPLPLQNQATTTVPLQALTNSSILAVQLGDLVVGNNGVLGYVIALSSTAAILRTLGNNILPTPISEQEGAVLTVQKGEPAWLNAFTITHDEDNNTITFM